MVTAAPVAPAGTAGGVAEGAVSISERLAVRWLKKHFLFFIASFFTLYITAQYTVGVKTISYTDAARSNRAVGVEFHYPGTNTAVAAGQFPFVIFAHGFSMNQVPYAPYADTLAKRGYIVGLLTTETGLSPSHANFAQDLIFMYGKLIAEASNNASFFYQHVIAKGALGGHSMGGGSTVLLVIVIVRH